MKDIALVSIQIGLPKLVGVEDIGAAESAYTTGSFKEAVEGEIWLGLTNLAGDGQGDMVNHGGPHKAVCVYSADHYPAWQAELSKPAFTNGAFGENFSVAGVLEPDVCIGDIFNVGAAVVQVAQPRIPCWKLARRWGIDDMVARVQESDRTGWYLRVLTEGYVVAGTRMALVERPYPQWTISAANKILRDRNDLEGAASLASCELLAPAWRKMMRKRTGDR